MNNFFLLSAYFTPYEDETDEILKKVFFKDDIIHLKNTAEKLNLHCLRWISYESKTFFNGKQSLEIQKNELSVLKNDTFINKKLLEQIDLIANAVIKEGFYFLKFEPVPELFPDHEGYHA